MWEPTDRVESAWPTRRGIFRLALLTLGVAEPNSATERRYAGLVRGAGSAVAARGVGMLATLVTVPLTIGYLGPERYGAWVTIASVVAWLSIADLGIANHLTNALSSAHGRADDAGAREAIATGLVVLGGVAGGILAVGLPVVWAVPWASVFNVHGAVAASEVARAMQVALILFCLTLPLTVIDRAYIALQRGAEGNAWAAAGTIASVLAIVAAVMANAGVPALVLATMGSMLATKAASAAWLFARERRELRPTLASVSRRGARAFVGSSVEFFLVQIAALVLFSTDNLVVAAVLGADRVPQYSVTWTLFGLSNAALALAFPYLWSAYAEAMARGDIRWVVRTLKLSLVGATGAAALVLLPLVFYGRTIIQIWAGGVAVPDTATVAWMTAWNLLLAPAMGISCFLNAAGKTRVQAWAGLVAAPANIAASVLLAKRYGGSGVIAATVLTYAMLAVTPTVIVATREVRRLRGASRDEVRA